MLPEQRGLWASWISQFRSKRKGANKTRRPARRGAQFSRSCGIEPLEDRRVLTATVYVDFGNLFSGGTLTTTVQDLERWGIPINTAQYLFGPQLNYGDPNTPITLHSLSSVVSQKGLVFDQGDVPIDSSIEFEEGQEPPLLGYQKLEVAILNDLARIFAPYNMVVAENNATAITGATNSVQAALESNNALLDPTQMLMAPVPPTDRGPDFSTMAPTSTKDVYIFIVGVTTTSPLRPNLPLNNQGEYQVGQDTSVLGAAEADRATPPLTDPELGMLTYSDGGGIVMADTIIDMAEAQGWVGTTTSTKNPNAINPDVAMANVAAQMAGITYGLGHTSDGIASTFNPFFNSNVQILSASDIMREGSNNLAATGTATQTLYPTLMDPAFFSNFYVMSGDFNQTITNVDNPYLDWVSNADVGAHIDPTSGAVDTDYVTGTGAYDIITITKTSPTKATVTIKPYSDPSFASKYFISTTYIPDPTKPNVKATTSIANPYSYTIAISNGMLVIIDAGRGNDQINIDPALAKVNFRIYGGAGVDDLSLVDTTGTLTATVIDEAALAPTTSGIGNPITFNFDRSYDATIVLSNGLVINAPLDDSLIGPNLIGENPQYVPYEFDDTSVFHLEGFAGLDYEIPSFLGSNITVTSQLSSSLWTPPASSTGVVNMEIDGTVGSTALQQVIGLPNIEFTKISNVTLEVPQGLTNDNVTINSQAGYAAGLTALAVNLGPGDDSLTVNGSLLAGGNFTFEGGSNVEFGTQDTNTVNVSGNTNWNLTDDGLTDSSGNTLKFLNHDVQVANVTGGSSGSIFKVDNWSGITRLTGGSGADEFDIGQSSAVSGQIIADGGGGNDKFKIDNFSDTSGNSSFQGEGSDTFFVGALGVVSGDFALTGGSGPNTFYITNWTGDGDLTGGSGNDTFVFGTVSTAAPPTGNGDVSTITKQHSVFGGLGNDTLRVDDSGAGGGDDYTVDSTSVTDTSAFGGILFDTNLENIILYGSNGLANMFTVTPNARTAIIVNGQQDVPAIDHLSVVGLANAAGASFSQTGLYAGKLTFTGQKPITFTNIANTADFVTIAQSQQQQQQQNQLSELINELASDPLLVVAAEPGSGSAPLVKLYDVAGGGNNLLMSFYAYPQFNGKYFTGGVHASLVYPGVGSTPYIVVSPGTGTIAGGAQTGEVKVFDTGALAAGASTSGNHLVGTINGVPDGDLISISSNPLAVQTAGGKKTATVLLANGQTVEAPGLAPGTTLTTVKSATVINLSAAATTTGTVMATIESDGFDPAVVVSLTLTKGKATATVSKIISVGGLSVGQFVTGATVSGTINSLAFAATPNNPSIIVTLSAAAFGSASDSLTVANVPPGFFPEGASYTGGLYVGGGDMLADGNIEIVTSRATGVPNIQVFDLTNDLENGVITPTVAFNPYLSTFNSGAQIAVGDVTGDGSADIVTVPGSGQTVQVKVFDYKNSLNNYESNLTVVPERSFLGFESSFKKGVSLTVGDFDGATLTDANGTHEFDEIALGAGSGGLSRVRIFNEFGTMVAPEFKAFTTGSVNSPLRIAASEDPTTMEATLWVAQSNVAKSHVAEGIKFADVIGAGFGSANSLSIDASFVDAIVETDPGTTDGLFLG